MDADAFPADAVSLRADICPGTTLAVHATVPPAPGDPPSHWLPMAAALAAADAVRSTANIPVEIEWPAELTVPGGMCGGSAGSSSLGAATARVLPDGSHLITVVLRTGTRAADLEEGTTSITASGGRLDEEELADAVCSSIDVRLGQWRSADSALAADYRSRCATVGRRVAGDDRWVSGIDAEGGLLLSP